MSVGELDIYKELRNHKTLQMPGRIRMKNSLHGMYAHLFGMSGVERVNIFQLCVSKTFFAVVYVDSVRMDISKQTVFIDAALVPFHLGRNMQPLDDLLSARRDRVAGISMKDDEVAFWKHLLPAFAERCRQWQHKPSCEYKTAGCVPISTDSDKPYMCTCGLGVFPKNYLKDAKQPRVLLKHAVRVAIPGIFASPINTDDVVPAVPMSYSPAHQ
jgi:hypothetical protein